MDLEQRLVGLFEASTPEEQGILLTMFALAAAGDEAAEVEGFMGPRSRPGAGSAISQGADLEMIQIQSLFSQRQQAMQLCNQMMQSQNDDMNSILKNVR